MSKVNKEYKAFVKKMMKGQLVCKGLRCIPVGKTGTFVWVREPDYFFWLGYEGDARP